MDNYQKLRQMSKDDLAKELASLLKNDRISNDICKSCFKKGDCCYAFHTQFPELYEKEIAVKKHTCKLETSTDEDLVLNWLSLNINEED